MPLNYQTDRRAAAPVFQNSANHRRHSMDSYVRDAYTEIKTKVLEAIADEYDWLWDECWRQEQRMWDQEMDRI
jgi:hypothetical protein